MKKKAEAVDFPFDVIVSKSFCSMIIQKEKNPLSESPNF